MVDSSNRQSDENAQALKKRQGQGIQSNLIRLFVFVAVTGGLFYSLLSLVQPQYRSVAQLLVEPVKGRISPDKLVEEGISQLRSKKLLISFVEKNRLAKDAEFNGVLAHNGPMKRVAMMMGITTNPADLPQNKRVRQAFGEKLSITKGSDPQIIKIAVRSSSPDKSARLANGYADSFLKRLRTDVRQPKVLKRNNAQNRRIKKIHTIIAMKEADLGRVQADIRANPFLIAELPVAADRSIDTREQAAKKLKLGEEQYSNLVTQHILAKADREEAELRAKLVRDMLANSGELQSTGTVLNSGLIQRLLIKRSRLERRLADLEVALLPSHPQLKRLHREMSALRAQVQGEGRKAAANLEDEARIIAAREKSLKDSLEELKNSAQTEAEAPMALTGRPMPEAQPVQVDHRLKRQGEINRSIARQRQKLIALQDALAAPAKQNASQAVLLLKASIISRAVAVKIPVFPKKKPITLLGMLAAFCLGLIALLFGARQARQARDRKDEVPEKQDLTASKQAPPVKGGLPSAMEFGSRPLEN